MPVADGGLSTRLGVSETNRVPRRRSSRMTGGWPDGLTVGSSGSCAVGRPAVGPSDRPSATTRPAALETDNTPGLVSGFGAAVRTGWGIGRGFPGFFHLHTPRI